jgi:SP family general alpha glucoside:H+ symporter-like MFS transporter
MLLNLSLMTGFVYGAFSLPICICMWLFIPETKG